MPPTAPRTRLARVQDSLAGAAADWLVVSASSDFRWLTGATARNAGRPEDIAVVESGEARWLNRVPLDLRPSGTNA